MEEEEEEEEEVVVVVVVVDGWCCCWEWVSGFFWMRQAGRQSVSQSVKGISWKFVDGRNMFFESDSDVRSFDTSLLMQILTCVEWDLFVTEIRHALIDPK